MSHLKIRKELVDEYEHIDEDLEYVVENILQEGDGSEEFENLEEDFYSTISSFCQCDSKTCDHNDCFHGGNYEVKDNQLVLRKDRKCKDVIYECTQNCKCDESCLNKYVQFGPVDGLKLIKLENKGYGLVTTKSLIDGTFICEYAGELLIKSEAFKRDRSDKQMNYIMCLNEISSTSAGNKIQTFVDPSRKGNIGRYLNHSCDPNCEIISVRVDSIIPKIAIFAKRHIAEDEELTFSYGLVDSNNTNENSKLCLCGAKNCQIYLPNLSFS